MKKSIKTLSIIYPSAPSGVGPWRLGWRLGAQQSTVKKFSMRYTLGADIAVRGSQCAQRRGGGIQVGWQRGKPDLTSWAKRAEFTICHCQTRRAGCVETRLSGSMEACWRNPPDLSSGRVRRVIPAFYPIAIALKQGDADMPRWNSWQRLGHRGCVDLRRCAANFGRPKLRGKSAQGVRDYRAQAPGPFNLRWRGECPSW